MAAEDAVGLHRLRTELTGKQGRSETADEPRTLGLFPPAVTPFPTFESSGPSHPAGRGLARSGRPRRSRSRTAAGQSQTRPSFK